ncbi:MAG: MarR family transcriptional regulator, partial [Bacteroidota bacterium]
MTDKFDFEKDILPQIGKMYKEMGILLRQQCKVYGVDMTREQFILLKTLQVQDGLPQSDLAFITENNKSSITRLINVMERKNWVARLPSKADARINHIHLTKLGKTTLKNFLPIISELRSKIYANITEEALETTFGVIM